MKKIGKKLLTLLLSISLATSVISVSSDTMAQASEVTTQNDDFEIDEDGVLTKYNGSDAEVKIPDGVKKIGESSFQDNQDVEKIIMPNSVTSICSSAFLGCTRLKEINFSNILKYIYPSAFENCEQLGMIIFPDTVTHIGKYAFLNCENLQFQNLPGKLEKIDEGAFSCCRRLGMITFPNSIVHIGKGAFYNCENLQFQNLPEKLETIADKTFSDCKKLGEIIFPNSVTYIGEYAFYNCENMQFQNLPQNLKTMEEFAFAGCSNLSGQKGIMYIPKTLENAGKDDRNDQSDNGVFTRCPKIKKFSVDASNDSYWADKKSYVLLRKDNNGENHLVKVPEGKTWSTYNMGSYAKWIDGYAISYMKNLEKINLGVNVYHISSTSMNNNDRLERINADLDSKYFCRLDDGILYKYLEKDGYYKLIRYPSGRKETDYEDDTVTQLGVGAFATNYNIESVVLNDNMLEIPYQAFFRCSNLTSVDLPDDLNSIGERAFEGTDLKSLDLEESCPNLSTIGDNAFSGNSNLYKIKIPESVTEIGDNAFSGCPLLKIYCYSNSEAYRYAIDNDIDVVLLDQGDGEGEGYEECGFPYIRPISFDSNTIYDSYNNSTPWGKDDDDGMIEINPTGVNQEPTEWTIYLNDNEAAKIGPYNNHQVYLDANYYEMDDGTVYLLITVKDCADDSIYDVISYRVVGNTLSDKDSLISGYTDSVQYTSKDNGYINLTGKHLLVSLGWLKYEFSCVLKNGNWKPVSKYYAIISSYQKGWKAQSNVVLYKSPGSKSKVLTIKSGANNIVLKNIYLKGEKVYVNASYNGKTGWFEDSSKIHLSGKHKINLEKINVKNESLSRYEKLLMCADPENQASAETKFSKFHLIVKPQGNALKLTWNKLKGVDGYAIYGVHCGRKNAFKKLAYVDKNKATWSDNHLGQGNKKSGNYHKYCVIAFKNKYGTRLVEAGSNISHATTHCSKYRNPIQVKTQKTKKVIKVGKSVQLKTHYVMEKNRKTQEHLRLMVHYDSSNEKVATVTQHGVVKAKKKGTTKIYAYTQNGIYTVIKVTVK